MRFLGKEKTKVLIPSISKSMFSVFYNKFYDPCKPIEYLLDSITRTIIKERVMVMEVERLRVALIRDIRGEPVIQLLVDNMSVKEWIDKNYIKHGWTFGERLTFPDLGTLTHRNLYKRSKSNKNGKKGHNKYIRKKY